MAMPLVYRIRVCRACGEVGGGMDRYCLRCRERGTLEDRYECERCRRILSAARCEECEKEEAATVAGSPEGVRAMPAADRSRALDAPDRRPPTVDIRLD